MFLSLSFQSTLLQEERPPYTYTSRKPSPTFNPRSYKRSDYIKNSVLHFHLSFNPRSYKRSDEYYAKQSELDIVFQSTLLQEERPGFSIKLKNSKKLSIHAPTRGATTPHAHLTQTLTYFQSTLLQEERRTRQFNYTVS